MQCRATLGSASHGAQAAPRRLLELEMTRLYLAPMLTKRVNQNLPVARYLREWVLPLSGKSKARAACFAIT